MQSVEPQKLTPLPEGCAYQPGDEKRLATATKPMSSPGQTGDLPQGTYRYTISRESLLDAGFNEQNADLNAGVWTWTFRSGRWSFEQKAADGHTFGTNCEGYYDVNADTVAFTTLTKFDGGDCAPPTWSARYSARTHTLIWSALNVSTLCRCSQHQHGSESTRASRWWFCKDSTGYSGRIFARKPALLPSARLRSQPRRLRRIDLFRLHVVDQLPADDTERERHAQHHTPQRRHLEHSKCPGKRQHQ
jgi:hypothetical protein